MILRKLINKLRKKQTVKKVLDKITLVGNIPEITGATTVRLKNGSSKKDIIVQNNVMLLGCTIVSMCGGKVLLGECSKLGQGTKILCVDKVVIGDYTAIATKVTIVDNNNHPINPEYRRYMRTTPHNSDARSWIHSDHKPVIIGCNCWIGSDVRIQKGVTIGDNSIIAACSVVTKDVPANCIAAGNPARVVKTDIDKIPAPTSCKEFNEYIANKQTCNE